MRWIIATTLTLILMLNSTASAYVGSKKAAYIGGTVQEFSGAKGQIVGELDVRDEGELRFRYKFSGSGRTFLIPYKQITSLEYGQKIRHRVAEGAAALPIAFILPVWPIMFTKQRQHFLTIKYEDSEKNSQVAIFELGKDLPRVLLPVIEVRAGKKVEMQDAEARNSRGD